MSSVHTVEVTNTIKQLIQKIISTHNSPVAFENKNKLQTFLANLLWTVTNENNNFSPKTLYAFLHFFESRLIRGIIYPKTSNELILELILIFENILNKLSPTTIIPTSEHYTDDLTNILRQIIRIFISQADFSTEITSHNQYKNLIKQIYTQALRNTNIKDKEAIKYCHTILLTRTIRSFIFPATIQALFLEILQLLESIYYTQT